MKENKDIICLYFHFRKTMILLKDVVKKISFAEYLTTSFIVLVGMSLLYKHGFYNAIGVDWYSSIFTPQYLLTSFVFYLIPTLIGIVIGGYLGICFNDKKLGNINIIACLSYFVLQFVVDYFFYNYQVYFNVCFLGLISSLTLMEVYFRQEREINYTPTNMDKFLGVIPVLLVISVLTMPYILGRDNGVKLIQNKHNLNYAILADKSVWRIVESSNDKILLLSDKEKNTFKIVEFKDIDKIIAK